MIKKIRLRTLVIFSFATLSGGLLFYTSQSVQRAESELAAKRAQLAHEQEAIRVLNAEWAYLNSPERLEALASAYLDLAPPDAGHILPQLSSLPDSIDLQGKENKGFQQIVVSPQEGSKDAQSYVSDIFVTPPKKPHKEIGRKPPAAGKSFDALLNELESSGGGA